METVFATHIAVGAVSRKAASAHRAAARLPGPVAAFRGAAFASRGRPCGRSRTLLPTPAGWLRQHASVVRNGAGEAVQVTDVEAEVDDADGYYLEIVNDIVAAGTWDAVQAKVAGLVKEGKMNERVLEAALMLLQECRTRQLPDNVVATMESVCELLTRAVEDCQMTPTMRLMRQLSEFNPKVPNEVAEIEQMMEQAFARDVAFSDFREDVEFFLKAMEDEESALPAADAAAAKEQQAQFEIMRRDAKERMSALLEIATTSSRVAKVVEASPAVQQQPQSGAK